MPRNYNLYFRQLNCIFEKEVAKVRKDFDKEIITYCMPDIYNRWLHCANKKNSFITPANIFMSLSGKSNLFPVIKNFFDKKVVFEPVLYSLENHPVVNDIKIIIENFLPIYDLQIGFNLSDANVRHILSAISMFEPNYLEYLKIICFRLNIFEILPSIHCKRLGLSKNAYGFLKKSTSEIFDLVFDETLMIFYENICTFFSIDCNCDDYNFFIDLFKNPCSISEIMSKILFHFNEGQVPFIKFYEDDSFNDCLYYLNIIVNRFFFLTFGHYLKLILPIYNHPFNLKLTLSIIKKYIDQKEDIYRVFDYNDTRFTLTDLGEDYLEIEGIDVFDKLSENEVDYLINNFNSINEKQYPIQDSLVIYKLKIEVEKAQKYWKTFNCSSLMSLHDLFLMVCNEFFLPHDSQYSFLSDNAMQSDNYNLGNSNEINLNKLHFTSGDSFFLVIQNQINYYSLNDSKLIDNNIKLKIYVYSVENSIKNIYFDYKMIFASKAFNKS
jgi:hypothetical protein